MDPRIAFHTLQNYRHRGPLIVAMEPDPIPEGLGRWEKAAEPLTQAGAGLFVWTPAGGPDCAGSAGLEGPCHLDPGCLSGTPGALERAGLGDPAAPAGDRADRGDPAQAPGVRGPGMARRARDRN